MNNIQKELLVLQRYIEQPSDDIVYTRREALVALSTIAQQLENIPLSIAERREIYSVIEPYTHIDLSKGFTKTLNKIKGMVLPFPSTSERLAHNCIDKLASSNNEAIKKLNEEMNAENRAIHKQYSWLIQEVIDGDHENATPQMLKEIILRIRAEHPRRLLTPQEEMKELKRVFQNKLQELEFSETSSKQQFLVKFMGIFKDDLFALDSSIHAALQSGQSTLIPSVTDPNDLSIIAMQDAMVYRLEHLEETYQESRKDLSGQVFTKYFPDTDSWVVGIFQPDGSYSPLQKEMQVIASENGITLLSEKNSRTPGADWESHPNQLLLECEGIELTHLNPYLQDQVDFCKNGHVKCPRIQISPTEKTQLVQAITQSRNRRLKLYETCEMETLGAVFVSQLSTKTLALASSLGASSVMNLTINEGGNTLFGQKGSEPYVIIGKDSYAASKFLMEKTLDRTMSHEEVCKAFAIDYGIDVKNVFFVEQPGDFHLDMAMAVIGEKTILLNDSKKAQELFEKEQDKWLENFEDVADIMQPFIEEERKNAEIRDKLEEQTKKDLEAQGFKVIRIPGKFNYSARTPAMNLFNMVTATTPEGKKIVVMLGCPDKKYEQEFEKILRDNSSEPIDKVYFLKFSSSQECLGGKGGISCRTKTIGFIRSTEKKET